MIQEQEGEGGGGEGELVEQIARKIPSVVGTYARSQSYCRPSGEKIGARSQARRAVLLQLGSQIITRA